MKICINIKVWQRPDLFRNVLRSIRDQETEHEIEIVCAVSEDDPMIDQNINSMLEFGTDSIWTTNLPLRAKGNLLVDASRKLDWDYLMILGSDDVVGPGFFDAYDFDAHPEAWGWTDLYLWDRKGWPCCPYANCKRQATYAGMEGRTTCKQHSWCPADVLGPDSIPGRFCYWPGYDPAKRNESVGAGRVLRRDIVEKLGWAIHGGGDAYNLDKSTTERLAAIGVTIPHGKLPEGVYMVDCKDSVSITALANFDQGVLVDMPVPAAIRSYL